MERERQSYKIFKMKIIIAADLYIADDIRNQDLIDKSVFDLFETAD